MSLFSFLFGSRKPVKAAATSAYREPTNSGQSFDDGRPDLIHELEADHRLLFKLYNSMLNHFDTSDFHGVRSDLLAFESAIAGHLVKENSRLYVRIGRAVSNDPEKSESMKAFQKEMNVLGPVVMDFLMKYKPIHEKPELRATFREDLEDLGKALEDRTRREEAFLYPMYVEN